MLRGNLLESRFAPPGARLHQGSDHDLKQWSEPQKSVPSYGIRTSDIKEDLTAGKGRPQWILSTYGPGRNPPASLLDGNELSFEELRLRFYELASQGNQQQADAEANALWAKAEAGMQDILNNIDNVPKFIEEAEKKHPNRIDLCQLDGTKNVDQVRQELQNQNQQGVLGTGGNTTGSNPFSQPAGAAPLGQPSTTFGQPSFGSTAFGKPQPGGFGQPAFGQASTSSQTPAFGQPSQPQQNTAFGQPSQPSSFGKPAFGQPSQPAQPTQTAFGQAGFGQPSQPSAFGQPTFGQPSGPTPFGQPSVPGFGQPSAPATAAPTPAFGQPSQPSTGFLGAASQPAAFGQTPFGQPSQPQTTQATSPFGQTQPASQSPFAAKPPQSLPFGAPSQSSPSPFNVGAASGNNPFGQPAQSKPQAQAATISPATLPKTSTGQPHPLTGKPTAAIHYTQTLSQTPPTTKQVIDPLTKRPKKILTTYRGCKVVYNKEDKPCYDRPDGKGLERIFFPDGEPGVKPEEVAVDDAEYSEPVVNAYRNLYQTGEFEKGAPMPMVPPKLEWGTFDF